MPSGRFRFLPPVRYSNRQKCRHGYADHKRISIAMAQEIQNQQHKPGSSQDEPE